MAWTANFLLMRWPWNWQQKEIQPKPLSGKLDLVWLGGCFKAGKVARADASIRFQSRCDHSQTGGQMPERNRAARKVLSTRGTFDPLPRTRPTKLRMILSGRILIVSQFDFFLSVSLAFIVINFGTQKHIKLRNAICKCVRSQSCAASLRASQPEPSSHSHP